MHCPSRSEIVLRARMPRARSSDIPALSLSVGLAYFNPLLPIGINELLQAAEQAMYQHKRVTPNRIIRADPYAGLARCYPSKAVVRGEV
jgi:GGDEF domain-containing protein